MKKPSLILCTSLILASFHLAAHADETPVASTPVQAESNAVPAVAPATPTTATTAAAKGTLAEKQVPKLVMRWDCGDCKQNEKVLPLIETLYANHASKEGLDISDAETAELSITEFRQRPPASRVMFGMFAGKDLLVTKIKFRGKEITVDDYALNIFQGMNSLCDSVATKALKEIQASLKTQ